MEYCEHHRGEPLPTTDSSDNDDARKRTTDISEWDQKFITVDQEMLFEIILAANYLDIQPLLLVYRSCNRRGVTVADTSGCCGTGMWVARPSPT